MRDRVNEWLGTSSKKPAGKVAAVQEVSLDSEVLQLLKAQNEQMNKQQKQIDSLLEAMKKPRYQGNRSRPQDSENGRRPRTCFRCGSDLHLIKECPEPPTQRNQRNQGGSRSSNPETVTADTAVSSEAAGSGSSSLN